MSIVADHRQSVIALLVAWLILAGPLSCGCHYFYDRFGEEKRIPSPLSEKFPFEVDGKIYRVWCGNELQIKNGDHTSYLILQGVNNPDRGPAIEAKAISAVHALLTDPLIQATVYSTDEQNRFLAQVRCGDHDINLEMIESGWAQWDRIDFARAKEFEAAETMAKSKKLGMWAND